MSKRSLVLIAVLWLVVLVAGITSALTINLTGTEQGWNISLTGNEGVYISEEEYEMLQRYSRLEEVRLILSEQYYMEVDDETLLTGAVRGMMDSLNDRYTFYYTVDEMTQMKNNASGEYMGIGVSIAADTQGNLTIYRVFSNTPAQRAGIVSGDILLFVNDIPVHGETEKDVDDAVDYIAQCGDKEITLTLMRNGEEYKTKLYREIVTMDRVEYEILEGDIGYVQIYDFLGNDVEGFEEAMDVFEQAGIRGLIIDVRDNTGGYLDDVVEIADMILPKGLVVYTEDRDGRRIEEKSGPDCVDYPVVCLVNPMSASASEVLAGAIQDYGVGAVIGETTFGKGIVQTVYPFSDGAGLQLTTATYFTPSGRCIHGTGVVPDYEVADDPATENDEALEYACQWLIERMESE